MRMIIALITSLLLVVAPTADAESAQDSQDAIALVLNAMHEAAARADGMSYFNAFAADAVFIGTDASERWPLAEFRAYAEPIFAAGKGWTYHPRERHIVMATVACNCIAWFDELLDSDSYGTSRGTGVMVRQGDDWKVAQYALSFPIPNDLAARMTGAIRAFEAQLPTTAP